ncbi:MAG: DNA mismatch repair endonuclease MutL [Roseomonas sp.]|nr:DNA mismatch repair endonuclease MutL [Roseomonas sp.]MCA3328669.1 DNA mismatch repair endonuclease MutL [Roseomonas sp.]MCA3332498.1 DNA mismatch repair endonuclease MutL [Roseomonas sp.]MCA3336173.1 DNA mismatch repair endonuclease MutL [Roseomonas sp.]MCA3353020.1 DNA mismatch repair endonuclease MutL [Roseomonas sp.]
MSAAPITAPRPAIRLLPETTANRIAAGEVVERPAAALKEIVENALDAGARRIAVTLEGGGMDRILVEDDGIGMGPEDLMLAVERHATSKLPEEATLFRIATLGFRGEALPSIGAVARLSITSCPQGGAAHRISVEGGLKGDVAPASGAPGTRVEVRDLFFATPARRKFLKHPRTEAEHAVEAVRRLALAWPEVAFRVQSDGREVLSLPATDQEGRIRQVLGAEFAAAAVPVEAVSETLDISGLAALPSHHRPTTLGQHLVVNRRPVRDPLLRVALRVAYRDVIPQGRHPVAALFLQVPPETVDVNVHPMKTELRFRDGEAVRGAMISALRKSLAIGAGTVVAVPSLASAAPAAGFSEALPVLPQSMPRPTGLPQPRLPLGFRPPSLPPPPAAAPMDAAHPLGRAVAQILDTYIIAEAADGSLVLVDQHAAHERLTHEALSAQLLEGGVRAQPLLVPAVVDMPQADAARLLGAAEALARLGLEIESFGAGAVLVRSLPALLGAADPAPLLRDMAEELAVDAESIALERKLDAAIARLACHGSIRAGRRLNAAEMDALLRQMEATPRAATCSHGRPTVLKLDAAALERMFGRR